MRSEHRLDERCLVGRENSFVATVNEDDPSVATARGRHTSRLTRGDRSYVATSNVSIQATLHHFDVVITLAVEIDGSVVFTRRWVETIPRHLL
jgi:hypothetical protein